MLIRVLPAVVAGVLIIAGALALSSRADTGVPLLPDLRQEPPSDLVVTLIGPGHPAYWLGFRSGVSNVGAGPLYITGHRHDRGLDTMIADQVIQRRGGPAQVVRGIGRLRYVVSPDHRHWHFLGFERYVLRRPGGNVTLSRDRKTGFCLGDRYSVTDVPLAAKPAVARYTSDCGVGMPALLGVSEGVSVGYGDDYAANLEGQFLPLTGLPDGQYELVHEVNVNRRIRELDYGNDAASTLIGLRWRNRMPQVTVLRSCPGQPHCLPAAG
jgi:hypothetical protein